MPAEWEPHAASWLAWPHSAETWPGCLERARDEFETLVRALLESEPVHVLVQDADLERDVGKRLGDVAVRLHRVETDDAWLRDTGPTFVHGANGALIAVDWHFNAWGGKYPPWERDDAVASRVAALAGTTSRRAPLVTEGGALEVDGEGTLLATETSLLCETRNPGADCESVARTLGRWIGAERVVWLPGGLAGDDTDGHVDDVARFVAPGRVVCAVERDPADRNFAALAECRARLSEARDARGRALEVVDLPMPRPLSADGERLPASYANFYVANREVLVPVFGVPEDEQALACLARLFPGRRARPIPSRTLVRGLGAIHCLTQQQPAL